MTFTQNSEIYVALQDIGINRLIKHVMVQQPSLFNYGSVLPVTNPQPVCKEIITVPQVVQAKNPLITLMDPFMIPIFYEQEEQKSIRLDYIVQVTNGEIDLFPGNIFSLPPELNPPLKDQQLAVYLEVYAGLICQKRKEGELSCLRLNLFSTCNCGINTKQGSQTISINVLGIEIPEFKPEGMESMIECISLLYLNNWIIPKMLDPISAFIFNVIKIPHELGNLRLLASSTVPHNPAVEDNQIKMFANFEEINLNLPPSSSGNGNTGTVTRTTRSRNREGAFDLTAAVSTGALKDIYTAIVKGFRFSKSGTGNVGYEVSAHLEGGSLEMRDDGTIVIKELDIKWDRFKLDIVIDIPKQCVGGGKICVLPPFPSCNVPCGGCVTLPSYCFFEGSKDITIPIDLSGLITSEVTLGARVEAFYGIGSGIPNRWQIAIVPTLPFDLEVIDIADSVGDLFKSLVQGKINSFLETCGAPESAVALVKGILGDIDNIIRNILDITDDIGEWLIDKISQIEIFQPLLNDLYDYIAFKIPAVFEIEDPLKVPDLDGILVPVKIPVEFIGVSVNSHEIVIEGDVGN
ncbi:hypothetical protein RSJ42_13270 [Methanosarcina hadiensis]|uniref:hypothetical protein n=1 Tax=Methanosarcina hadiensis TaxID=3078083 RepID=UPI0039779CDD